MNDTLDVLRYWLPEWEFDQSEEGLLFWSKKHGRYLSEWNADRQQPHADYLAAKLRRKYLERKEVRDVWLRGKDTKLVSIVTKGLPQVTVCDEPPGDPVLTGSGDTELLATIAAGKRLKEALEGIDA